MKTLQHTLSTIILSLIVGASAHAASTPVAWWRFEAGPNAANVSHSAGAGVFSADIPDSSGSGNNLSAWSTGGGTGYAYTNDVPWTVVPGAGVTNQFSVKNTGGFPAMFTQSNSPFASITPLAWTIEITFKPENGGYRTLVGRDSRGTSASDTNLAVLYLQAQPDNSLAIKYGDVAGVFHLAVSGAGLVQGYTAPNTAAGSWQSAVAVCDGTNLSLYYKNITAGDPAYTLVAQTNLTGSSANLRLSAGAGSGSDWFHGVWSVGRGLYAGGHTDRAFGFIDEVRISTNALPVGDFLLTRQVVNTSDAGLGSLRQCVADAVPGETITFASSLSGQTILLTNATGEILLNKNLTIDGSALGSPVQINGNHNSRIFECASGTTNSLTALTLNNGYASAGHGGALLVNNNATLTVSNCTLANNSASGGGGGIYNESGTLTLNNSTLANNTADSEGGGINNNHGTVTLNNSTLAGNSSVPDGGGIYNFGTLTVNNSTLANNSADFGGGGGIFNGGTALNLTNSIVSVNSGGNIDGLSYSGINNLVDVANINLAPLGNYGGPTPTMPPLPGSPAIDAGSDSVASQFTTDQRGSGFARIAGAHVDIGAVESGNAIPGYTYTVVTTTNDFLNGLTNNGVSLRSAVAFAPTNATITFATNLSGSTITLASEILLNKNLTIDGSALLSPVILNGNNASRLFYITNATVTLNGLTLTNASAMSSAFYNGGGAAIANVGTLTVTNCLFTGNTNCNEGGAIYCVAGSLTLERSTFAGNACNVEGGAIRNVFVPFTARQCTFTGNRSAQIAGACSVAASSAATLVNCTVVSNTAAGVVRNSGADHFGGGGLFFASATANLTNCIVAGNACPAGVTFGIDIEAIGGSVFNVSANLVGDNDTMQTTFPTGPLVGTNNAALNPQLAPLNSYGGPTMTMLPLPGSPAIDAGSDSITNSFTTDQRGLSRKFGAHVDIGAVELQSVPTSLTVVTTTSDDVNSFEINGVSLREAVLYATNNATITFAPNLSGQTILLTNNTITMNKGVTIDASSLSNGVSIDGNHIGSVFYSTGGTNILTALTITNGNGLNGLGGGGIYNAVNLTLNRCTVAGNSTFGRGGGIYNDAKLTLNNSTLVNNSADDEGGGIYNANTLTVNNSTLVNNSASFGGGIRNSGTLKLTNSIVCANSASFNPNIDGSIFSSANNLIDANAVLAPLANYGGPTMTMPPLPGSPAIDAGSDSAASQFTTDQRGAGFARLTGAHVDIGAVESGNAIPGYTYGTVVNTNADFFPNGLETNIVSLRSAVAFAPTNATITFSNTLSGSTILLTNASGEIVLNKNLTINGSTLTGGIQISGDGNSRIFECASGTTNGLTTLTLTNGFAGGLGFGGALLVNGSATLVISNCTLTGNSADIDGGGIYSFGTLTLNNSTLANNSGGDGGGIFNSGTLTLYSSTLASNSASFGGGGGIANFGSGALSLTNSIVSANFGGGGDIVGISYSGISNLVGVANINLAPLANYGGPTMTMPPLPGSPAIDAGAATALTTDQRGLPRKSGSHVDIGAVELYAPLVTTKANSGAGSLRDAVSQAESGATIVFTNTLSGQTIFVTNGSITLNNSLTIDGSALPDGVTLNGGHTNRIFVVNSGTTNVLVALTLTNGYGGDGTGGGGILNNGWLTVNNSTLAGNSTPNLGGAILNNSSSSVLFVNQSTLTRNTSVGNNGGAIYNFGTLTVNQSTVTTNTAGVNGGGIRQNGVALTVSNSIVAGNTAGNSPVDINIAAGTIAFGVNFTNGNPMLAPLGNYGGPTMTMPPLTGSPAIDACTSGTSFTTDQRGFPRIVGAFADFGAVEGAVILATTPPVLANATRLGNGSFQFNFSSDPGALLTVWTSTNVALPFNVWSNLGAPVESPAGTFQFTDPQATNSAMRFYRVSSP